jgi:hypothetical protein
MEMNSLVARRGSSSAWLAAAAVAAVMVAAPATSADTASAAREMSHKWGDAVVTVKVVMKVRWVEEGRQADEREQTTEANGTVIDPSGLVVCSLAEVDPASQRIQEPDEEFKVETEVTDLKLILPDGREIKAKVVLRDKDLDLAFIRPWEKLSQPLVSLDLSKDAQPEVLDEVVFFGRMSQTGNRAKMVAMDRITALIEKPRRVYVVGMNAYLCGLGCPALSPEGKVVGVLFMRAAPPGAARRQSSPMPVVVPSAQILSVASQASQ